MHNHTSVTGGHPAALLVFWLKPIVCFSILAVQVQLSPVLANAEEWSWMSGSDTIEQPGIYGTQGVPHPDNVPGARSDATTWLDAEGNLWLMGGHGRDGANVRGYLNDLWRYDGNGEWTWVGGSDTFGQAGTYGSKGVPHSDNIPGARARSVSWFDDDGNLWLLGGFGYDSAGDQGHLNDLWRYDSNGEWAWMGGFDTMGHAGVYGSPGVPHPDNMPGARNSSVSWVKDDGSVWIMGGNGHDSIGNHGRLNDLWRYDKNGEWTWMSGSNVTGQFGNYGTKGVPHPNNVPGARSRSASWIDSDGNLWLMGGLRESLFAHNDLWRYDLNGEWTWISGSNFTNQSGSYGVIGNPNPNNVPSSRGTRASWIDAAGNFWLMGGHGRDGVNSLGNLNDLWRYDTNGEWAWMSGSFSARQPGVYGTKGEPSPLNVPGARTGSMAWSDAAGNLWLMGGYGRDGSDASGRLNDLWRYELLPTFTVSTNAVNGTITSPVNPVAGEGDVVTVTGSADEDYYFSSVSGCGGTPQINSDQSISNFIYETAAVTENCTVTAEFEIRTYTITTTVIDGTITSETDPLIEHGAIAIVTGKADDGHYFAGVSGCSGVPQDNADQSVNEFAYETAPVVGDCGITAEFIIKSYTVTPSAGAGGSISPADAQSIEHGETVTFQATAEPGYAVNEVGGSCGGTLSDAIYTTETILGDCSVEASFRPSTMAETFSDSNPAIVDQVVAYLVEVSGTDFVPSDGQVVVEASTGESCLADGPSSFVGNVALFDCQITYSSPGSRSVTALFDGSSTHGGSTASAIIQQVVSDAEIFSDQFEIYVH